MTKQFDGVNINEVLSYNFLHNINYIITKEKTIDLVGTVCLLDDGTYISLERIDVDKRGHYYGTDINGTHRSIMKTAHRFTVSNIIDSMTSYLKEKGEL